MVHVFNSRVVFELTHDTKQEQEVIYGKFTDHDRQTDRQTNKVYIEITRKALAHACSNYCTPLGQAVQENNWFLASVLAFPTVGPILPALN